MTGTPSAHFVEVANTVTARVSTLLCAPVVVTNQRGIIVTSSNPEQIGHSLAWDKQKTLISQGFCVSSSLQVESGDVVVGEPYGREAIPVRLAHALVELVVNQTLSHLPQSPQQGLKHQLIDDLLHNRMTDEAETLNAAKVLGMDLSQPRAVILIDASDYIVQPGTVPPRHGTTAVQQRRAQRVIGSIVSFFHLPSDTICADLGEGHVCVLKASNTKNLDSWATCDDISEGLGASWANLNALRRAADALLLRLRGDTGESINIGIGRYHPGLQGLARSYEDARVALSLGMHFQGCNRVHCLAELGIAAFIGVADEDTKIDLAKYLLSPLDQDPELLMTLDQFFAENCCPSSTARQLSIHRNTLGYRLDKITTLTGLDPRRFDDAVQMRLSLLLRSLSHPSIHSQNICRVMRGG